MSKIKIIDKTTGKELSSDYTLTEYGDVVCKTNDLVLLNSEDFEVKMDLKDMVLLLKETTKNVRHKAADIVGESENEDIFKTAGDIMNIQFKDVSPIKKYTNEV